MSSKSSLLVLGLLVAAASLPASLASAASLGSAAGADALSQRMPRQVANSGAQKQKAALAQQKMKQQQAALKKKKQQEAAAKAAVAAKKEQEKKQWYEDDRDRGLDIAEKYAPSQIKKVRKNNYIAKGDTVSTGEGKKGWQHYMDKYYKR